VFELRQRDQETGVSGPPGLQRESRVRAPVHPLGLRWEWLQQARTAAQVTADLLGFGD
jgi:hypothetical protein